MFCESFINKHITSFPFHPRSNGLVERFVDTPKRTLKKYNCRDSEEIRIHQFLSVYHMTPNPNTVSGMSPAELMFVRKGRSTFEKLLPEKNGFKKEDQYS